MSSHEIIVISLIATYLFYKIVITIENMAVVGVVYLLETVSCTPDWP